MSPRWPHTRHGRPTRMGLGDDGTIGGAEVLPLCVLVLVVGTLVMANAWAVVDARMAADAAAQAAVRRYVESPDATSARHGAEVAAREAISSWGRDSTATQVLVEHPDGRPFGRCTPVVVRVRQPVATVGLPLIDVTGGTRSVEARQSEIIDPYRSGPPGQATC